VATTRWAVGVDELGGETTPLPIAMRRRG
jgi:hypothetical protein